jgi:hypothetical protein
MEPTEEQMVFMFMLGRDCWGEKQPQEMKSREIILSQEPRREIWPVGSMRKEMEGEPREEDMQVGADSIMPPYLQN